MVKKIMFILLGAVTLVIVFFLFDNSVRSRMIIGLRRFSFVYRAFFAASPKTPEAAYEGFRQALVNSSVEANKYLSPSAQQAYRFILSKPEKQKMILSWPSELTKLYQVPCDEFEGCDEQAVYGLEYYQPETRVEIEGRVQEIKAGYYKRELVFIRRKDGGWWIKKL